MNVRHLVQYGRQLGRSARPFTSRVAEAGLGQQMLGFVGVGNMGLRMATNLLKAGHQVVVCDRNTAALEQLCSQGATACSTPAAVATTPGMRALITMLPSSAQVLEVYCGADGVFSAPGGVRPPLLIDSSTIDPGTARQVAAAAEATPLHPESPPIPGCSPSSPTIIDAPVSGGVPGAEAATLTFMCGGTDAALTAAEPYLNLMGKRVVRCGPSGNGQAAKVCNNLVLAVQMAGVAEGLALGRRLGLDPVLLSAIFNTSSARCWSSDTYNPCPGVMEGVPAARGYSGGFSSRLMVKDLGLAVAAAQMVRSPLPMGQAALPLYEQIGNEGQEQLDFGAIFQEVYGLGEDVKDAGN